MIATITTAPRMIRPVEAEGVLVGAEGIEVATTVGTSVATAVADGIAVGWTVFLMMNTAVVRAGRLNVPDPESKEAVRTTGSTEFCRIGWRR